MNIYRLAYLHYMRDGAAKRTAPVARKQRRPARRFGKLRALARRPKGGR